MGAEGQAPQPPTAPTGTLQLDATIRSTPSSVGVNRVSSRARGPHVADLIASNGTFVGSGGLRGTVHATQIVTDQGDGRPQPRGLKYLALLAFDFGNGDTLIGSAFISTDDVTKQDPTVDGTVLGGTGKYAGARGIGVQRLLSQTAKAARSRFTFTFMR
jgi:hypothetical protein